ncbi:Peptidase S46 [Candidatus Kryptobacter tengchongensis]|nr:Peptidase S46 [Candidatus Kryptobacter tengchongensis]
MLKYFKSHLILFPFLVILFLTGCSTYQATKPDYLAYLDTVTAGQFDNGKMWTFDYPPIDYFKKTYNFTPTSDWFERARLSALRLPGCSASFVSEDGLVMTNHHCARGALDAVNREGENLPETGFYAATLEEERKIPNHYVDQLIHIEDVTDEVQKAFEEGKTDEERVANRDRKIREIQQRYYESFKRLNPDDSIVVSVVTFYNGGKYSAYVYKRYTDVRLVYAPETSVAYFGGDPDNFTYPRYDLDVAFFRVYKNGKPLKTNYYFPFSKTGVKEGDVVFVIGNPGRTNRLLTVAQLEFFRDVSYPYTLSMLDNLVKIYSDFIAKHPDKKLKYQTRLFSFSNSQKAYTGRLAGLRDPYLMARKRDFEKKFKNAVLNNPQLKAKYSDLWGEIAKYQVEKRKLFPELQAYNFVGPARSVYFRIANDLVEYAEQMKLPEEKRAESYKGERLKTTKARIFPQEIEPELEKAILVYQLSYMKSVFGDRNQAFNELLKGQSPETAVDNLLSATILADKEKVTALLEGNPDDILKSNDPFISFVVKTRKQAQEIRDKYNSISSKESAKLQLLGRAIFDVYGTTIPPDATFTLRIADGVVKSYEYNGTIAPPVTTFYGLYDRHYSFNSTERTDWQLPERWKNPPSTFDLSTPLNFVATNDIIGGNSGSPVVNKDLEVVGLIFDGNIESLPGDFIYVDEKNRAVAVDVRGIIEALKHIYNADRLVDELQYGRIK